MERSWSIEAFKPTVVQTGSRRQWNGVHVLQKYLVGESERIADAPYFPPSWAFRANTLQSLGYPELAAGDAHKSIMLCEFGFCYDSEIGAKVRLAVGMFLMLQDSEADCGAATAPAMEAQKSVGSLIEGERLEAYRVLCSALTFVGEYYEGVATCQKALTIYPDNTTLPQILASLHEQIKFIENDLKKGGCSNAEIEKQMRTGGIKTCQYPRIPQEFFERSLELISACNAALKPYVDCIEMRSSSIEMSVTGASSEGKGNCFGYCAMRHIKRGEEIMRAPTAFGVSNQQATTHCYNCSQSLDSPLVKSSDVTGFTCCPVMRFCGAECRNIAEQSYHKTLCGKDFDALYKTADNAQEDSHSETSTLLWLRIFAYCVQEGGHPLEMPRIARLVAQYDSDMVVSWSYRHNVIITLDILQSLGVDIFADSRYDSWVIETIRHRIQNNSAGGKFHGFQILSLNEHYSGFNHSCKLPVMMSPRIQGSTAIWVASRRICKQEEIFTTYLTSLDVPKNIRSRKLKTWLGVQNCGCVRCKSEN